MKIIPLAQIDDAMLSEVGKKAFSLAKLLKGKFSVPESFVVGASVFHDFLHEHDLLTLIESELANVNVNDYHSVDYASRLLHDAILSAEFSDEISMEIMQQYKHINTELVAVRSSVFTEDEHSLPWSGKLVTNLRVGPQDLLISIKKCWASLFTSEALYQLLRKELKPADIHLAVVIQRMIDSEVTGICYSQHPISHNEHEIVIEAGIGLGNPTEDRIYTPDTYIIERDPIRIKEKMIHTQEVSVVPNDGQGTTVKDLETKKASQQKINDVLLKELVQKTLEIEALFGRAVAIEWLYAKQFYFLQVRVEYPHREDMP